MIKYELVENTREISYKDRGNILPGCTVHQDNQYPVILQSFGSKEDALNTLNSYKSEVRKLSGHCGTYFDITEYYVVINEYDEDGDWMSGGDILAFSKGLPVVFNPFGEIFDADVAEHYMDDDIKEMLHDQIAPCSAQTFFDRYAEEHEKKFGEEWELAKEYPVF